MVLLLFPHLINNKFIILITSTLLRIYQTITDYCLHFQSIRLYEFKYDCTIELDADTSLFHIGNLLRLIINIVRKKLSTMNDLLSFVSTLHHPMSVYCLQCLCITLFNNGYWRLLLGWIGVPSQWWKGGMRLQNGKSGREPY